MSLVRAPGIAPGSAKASAGTKRQIATTTRKCLEGKGQFRRICEFCWRSDSLERARQHLWHLPISIGFREHQHGRGGKVK
jgi:hypothetical protein